MGYQNTLYLNMGQLKSIANGQGQIAIGERYNSLEWKGNKGIGEVVYDESE